MATRRPRIVIKPNIKPSASKTSSQSAKAKPVQTSAVPEAPTAVPKLQEPSSVAESPAVTISNAKSIGNSDSVTDQVDDVDCSISGNAIKNSIREHEHTEILETLNDSRKSNKDDNRPTAAENQDKEGTVSVSATESVFTNLKSQETLADKKSRSNNDESHVPSGEISHSKVVSSKNEGDSCPPVPQLSDLPAVNGNQSDSEPISSKHRDNATEQIDTVDESCMSDVTSQAADDLEDQEIVLEDEKRKKPKRKRDMKERTEPLPPSDKSPDRQKMKMSYLISWNPAQNFFPKKKKKSNSAKVEAHPTPSESSVSVDDEASNESASLPAPQVMIGSDGNIVLNTESLMVGNMKNDGPKEIIEEDDDDRYLNTNSYRRTTKTKLWTEIENEKFFMGLSMCGTDFSLMCKLLPKRSRKELKNKFRREEKRNRTLIDTALSNRQRYDPTLFERMAQEEERLKALAKAEAEKKKKIKADPEKKKKIKMELGAKKDKSDKGKTKKPSTKKNKKPDSEDEEDDWGTDYDEEDEENLVAKDHPKPATKRGKKKKETNTLPPSPNTRLVYPNKPGSQSMETNPPQPLAEEPGEDEDQLFVPPRVRSQRHEDTALSDGQDTISPVPQSTRSHIPISESVSVSNNSASMQTSTSSNSNTAGSGNAFSRLQSIPGSSSIHIQMGNTSAPMQGVLLPSHLLPHIAPHLGIPQSNTPMQVLLVQEENSNGNMVHVYMVPEGESVMMSSSGGPTDSGSSHDPGGDGGGSLTLRSPVPSPHPSMPNVIKPPFQHSAQNLPQQPLNPPSQVSNPLDSHSQSPQSQSLPSCQPNSQESQIVSQPQFSNPPNPSSQSSLSNAQTSQSPDQHTHTP